MQISCKLWIQFLQLLRWGFFSACISNHFAADSATDFKQKFFEQRPSCRMPILVTSKPLAKKKIFSTVICWRSEQPTYSKQKSRVWSPKICKAFPLPTNSLGRRLTIPRFGVLHWYYCSHHVWRVFNLMHEIAICIAHNIWCSELKKGFFFVMESLYVGLYQYHASAFSVGTIPKPCVTVTVVARSGINLVALVQMNM